jgi:hypothetical protein
MRSNSQLASLFSVSTSDPAVNVSGLQTRTQVNTLIRQQIVTGGASAPAAFSQNMRQAQSQLNELKDNRGLSVAGNSNDHMFEGFRPNPEKSKTFFERIKLDADFQTIRHSHFFPLSTDLGISLAYQLNLNSAITIGSSFKMGWGTDFNHIRISNEGFSLRGGMNWLLKANVFMTGNYEKNFFSAIKNISQSANYPCWKESALLGLSKRYAIKKGRTGDIKLLYDFFSNHPPLRTQPLIIRLGYNLR